MKQVVCSLVQQQASGYPNDLNVSFSIVSNPIKITVRSIYRIVLLASIFPLFANLGWAQWATYAPMPTAKWGLGVVGHNGLLYATTGNGVFAHEAYNPLTNTWTSLAPIPVAVAYPAMAAYGGKVYVIGGTVVSTWQNIVQIYDIATNTWSTGANTLTTRMGGTAVAYNGRIYLATGWNGALMNSLEIYDIVSNTWTSGANAPTARYQTRSALIGGRMYIIGGYTSNYIGLNESYDIATNTWATHAPMPTARYLHAAGSDGVQMYVGAGYSGAASGAFQSYNPVSNSWTLLPNVPTPRYRVDGAYLNGCFYVAGGFNGSTLAILEGYCGLAILDANTLVLNASRAGDWVHLDWAIEQDFQPVHFELRKKEDGFDWLTIDQGAIPTERNLKDFAPGNSTLTYQMILVDANGDSRTSNLATLWDQNAEEGFFNYDVANANLLFEPIIPFPMDQGMATLWSMDGKVIREEKVVGNINWNLQEYPEGVYIFRWVGNGKSFQRKIIR